MYWQNLPRGVPLDVDLFWEQEAVLNLLCIYNSLSFPPHPIQFILHLAYA